ncbi:hypothetical protein QE152_g30946 [Popillia japonica]|uniref:MULE transposase domain-containing protein n=1 Tax=Popillia japonica TaxID=7064 RepID=A0AAW1JD24_POPJA
MEYVLSEKGNRKLVLQGFLFVKDKKIEDKIYCASLTSDKAGGQLPQLSSIKRTVRIVRNAHDAAPALPQTRQDLVIPEVYKQTLSGENFLQFDSGHLEWESRMPIFATQRSLNALERSEHWYMDGTFKPVSQIFAQLYTIHGLKDNLSIPLVYVLLPDKTEGLQKIKDLCPTATPSTIMIDFERATANAILTTFLEALRISAPPLPHQQL